MSHLAVVTERKIVGAIGKERTAVVTIAIPADGVVAIDPTWRFLGWLWEQEDLGAVEFLTVGKAPRVVIEGNDEEGWTIAAELRP